MSQPGRRVGGARLLGAVMVIGSVITTGWLLSAAAFKVDAQSVEITGVNFTDLAAVRDAVGLEDSGPVSLFRIPAQRIQRELAALSPVAGVKVRTVLPNRLVVALDERVPVLLVLRPDDGYLIDGEGVVLGRLPAGTAPAGLAVVTDERTSTGIEIDVGQRIDAVEALVMLTLGALTASALGSDASTLALSVDDRDGYVVSAPSIGWRAVFGQYTTTLRPPEIIGRQVECLNSILDLGEAGIDTVYLAPLDDRCGTFRPIETPRESPRESPTPSPAA